MTTRSGDGGLGMDLACGVCQGGCTRFPTNEAHHHQYQVFVNQGLSGGQDGPSLGCYAGSDLTSYAGPTSEGAYIVQQKDPFPQCLQTGVSWGTVFSNLKFRGEHTGFWLYESYSTRNHSTDAPWQETVFNWSLVLYKVPVLQATLGFVDAILRVRSGLTFKDWGCPSGGGQGWLPAGNSNSNRFWSFDDMEVERVDRLDFDAAEEYWNVRYDDPIYPTNGTNTKYRVQSSSTIAFPGGLIHGVDLVDAELVFDSQNAAQAVWSGLDQNGETAYLYFQKHVPATNTNAHAGRLPQPLTTCEISPHYYNNGVFEGPATDMANYAYMPSQQVGAQWGPCQSVSLDEFVRVGNLTVTRL